MKVSETLFGKHPEGRNVYSYKIENDNGIIVNILNYGGIISHLFTPDKTGQPGDIVLGFETLDEYLAGHPYFGAIVGRFANRISKGRFIINDMEYNLAVNNGPNHLHGGIKGFDKKIWTCDRFQTMEEAGVTLALESPDMEEGYPGNLLVEVQYSLNNKNELVIRYKAQTDQTTHINLTNHSYFNLSACKTNIYDHILYLDADCITEPDSENIPTGNMPDVTNTPFDFRNPKAVGKDIAMVPPGYDHNYVLNKNNNELKLISKLEHPGSGRIMETLTTEPGVQLYTSNFLDGSLKGKQNIRYDKHFAICLETQHFPDSPNNPTFPSTLLKPGNNYQQTTIYRFPTPK